MKNGTEANLNLSLNVIGDSNDEINYSQKLLLTDTQFTSFCKGFTNNSSANKKLSKTQLSKMTQLGGILPLDLSLFKTTKLTESNSKIIRGRTKKSSSL